MCFESLHNYHSKDSRFVSNCFVLFTVMVFVAASLQLEFPAPNELGKHDVTLYFMCDSYIGCDQEYSFELDVTEGAMVDE
jgi:hypothetical protein